MVLLMVERPNELDEVIRRIGAAAAEFNAKAKKPYRISFSYGSAIYVQGEMNRDFIKRMDETMYHDKKRKQR